MPDYLIDFYSVEGDLFKSNRITATDNADAILEARYLSASNNPLFFKVTLLTRTGNVIIHNSSKAAQSKNSPVTNP